MRDELPTRIPEQSARIQWTTPDYGLAEINAMAGCAVALAPLDKEARGRVLWWLTSKYPYIDEEASE